MASSTPDASSVANNVAVQLHVAWIGQERTLSASSIHPVLVQAYALRLSSPCPLSLGLLVRLTAIYPAAYHTPHLAVSTKAFSAYETHIIGHIVELYSPWDGLQLCVINNTASQHPVKYAYILFPRCSNPTTPTDNEAPPDWLHIVATRLPPLLSKKDNATILNNTGGAPHYLSLAYADPTSFHVGSIVPGIRCGPETRGAKLGCTIKRGRLGRKERS